MKNPFNGDLGAFKLSTPDADHLIMFAYAKAGTVYAFDGYSDRVIGKAGGYGYDKTGVALSEAIKKLTGIDLGDGARGWEAIMDALNEKTDYEIKRLV